MHRNEMFASLPKLPEGFLWLLTSEAIEIVKPTMETPLSGDTNRGLTDEESRARLDVLKKRDHCVTPQIMRRGSGFEIHGTWLYRHAVSPGTPMWTEENVAEIAFDLLALWLPKFKRSQLMGVHTIDTEKEKY